MSSDLRIARIEAMVWLVLGLQAGTIGGMDPMGIAGKVLGLFAIFTGMATMWRAIRGGDTVEAGDPA